MIQKEKRRKQESYKRKERDNNINIENVFEELNNKRQYE